MKRLFSLLVMIGSFMLSDICPRIGHQADEKLEKNSPDLAIRVPVIHPSLLFEELEKVRGKRPQISDGELAAVANALLLKKGLDYDFDACEVVKANNNPKSVPGEPEDMKAYYYSLKSMDGALIKFKLINSRYGGPCSSCYFQFPCFRVTKNELVVVSNSKPLHLERPVSFRIEEVSLVDESTVKVIRKWIIPFETVPMGVSEDGRKLYIDTGIDGLILELVGTSIRFRTSGGLVLPKGDESPAT